MRTAAITAVLLGIGLAGCGGGKPAASAPDRAAAVVTVRETEFKLSPSTLTVRRSGPISFKAVNGGKVGHSLEVEGNGVEKRIAGTIAPGASRTLTVTLKPGRYTWYCPVGGHERLGMKGVLTVARGAGGSSSGTASGGGAGGY